VIKKTLIIEPLADSVAWYKDPTLDKAVTLYLKPNKKRVLKFTRSKITFSDSGAVSLIYEGEDLGTPGKFAERKTIEFPSLQGL